MRPKAIFAMLKQTVTDWSNDNAPSRAASLSYYTVFSIAPLLIIAVAVAALAFGRAAVSGQLQHELEGLVGSGSAKAVQEMMVSASEPASGILATLLGIATLVAGAMGAFTELQDALNAIWRVEKKKSAGIFGFLRSRLLSFAMIGVIAFLLLVSLVVSTALSAFGHFARAELPGGEILFHALNLIVSFGVITVLFAAIYKVLPDAKVAWGDVWLGAAVTSFLFSIGKLLIGLYLGKTGVASSYGAAGSFAVLLIWINYSAMILFLGAEFTHVYAQSHGSRSAHIEPPRDSRTPRSDRAGPEPPDLRPRHA